MKASPSQTVVFITGAFVSSSCWDEWKVFFEEHGYACLVPPGLYKDASAPTLRSRQPDAHVASIRLTQLAEYYAAIVRQLPQKPILIGHSMGGLLTQLLLQQDLAAAGVAIHSVPPQGVITFKWSFYRSVWGPLGYFTPVGESFMMSLKQWQYAFTNGMPGAEQRASYKAFAIPESKRLSRDGLTAAAKIDFTRPHAPLLFLAGSTDHIIPASLNYSNYRRYQHAGSVTAYRELPGRNHFVLGQPGWREDALCILTWLHQLPHQQDPKVSKSGFLTGARSR
ncbi:alpha/beta hydrolase [Hymenobacter sp. BT491]|uniref:alpha/beta hydrolase n=1 Tax=Hymenobacter sp. BT491 TaxID=2766779 RepID=UPI0016538662|nr:alpha/beta hydrolase [Hymenobacter sp. BT491]MBC6992327.1 alpha/beta hydrolase [Hymenobacter sp. BT491]